MTTELQLPWLGTNGTECPMAGAIKSLSGKWKPMILHMLTCQERYFLEIARNLPQASRKMITAQLRELEFDGLIDRTEIGDARQRVRYSLSKRGQSLVPVLEQLFIWANANPPEH